MTTQVSNAGPVTPTTAVHDTATVHGNQPSKTPSGTVTFFLCGPIGTGACDGTTNVGSNIGTATLSGSVSHWLTRISSMRPVTRATIVATRRSSKVISPLACNRAGSAICFTVAKVPSSTTTSPSSGAIQLGDSITDLAVVTGTIAGGIPTGTVSFFICGPIATGTCDTGGTAVSGNPVTLGNGNAGPPPTASATSGAVTPTAVGRYCFRGEYSGDNHYLASSDSRNSECFTVSTTSSTSSAQTWLPNDSATITSAAPLSGSLSFTLHEGGDCLGAILRPAETFTFSGATSPVTRATNNTNVAVTTSKTVSWEVVFASTDSFVTGSSRCESTQLTITN